MSTFRECRSMFDAAVKSYQSGDLANARAAFGRLTVENPDMSDGWLGLLACGDHHLDTLAGAHQHSEALYSETRRVGLTDGELSAVVMAPMYLGLRVWSRATIGLAYASALIIADRHDEAAATLDDPVITEDTGAAQYRQFVMATLFHKTRSWSNLLKVTEISPPSGPPMSVTRWLTQWPRWPRPLRRVWANSSSRWSSLSKSRQPIRG